MPVATTLPSPRRSSRPAGTVVVVTVSPLQALSDRIIAAPAVSPVPGHPAGRLAAPLAWLDAASGRPPSDPHLLLVAADHAVASTGVTSLALDHGAQVAEAVRSGDHPVAVLAADLGVTVQVVAVSGAAGAPSPAMGDVAGEDEIVAALEHGAGVVAALAEAGTGILVLADTGAGATTTAALLIAAMTSSEPVRVTGRGHGLSDEAWSVKLLAVRDGLRRARLVAHDPVRLLASCGGPGPAVATGALVAAAAAGIPVLLDGVTGLAAALVARSLAPRSGDWGWPATTVSEPASVPALRTLARTPVLDLDLGRGEGIGGLLALQAVRAAHLALQP